MENRKCFIVFVWSREGDAPLLASKNPFNSPRAEKKGP